MNESLLETLSLAQIEDLIVETRLTDTNFYYAVDPNEFKSYCFPFIGKENDLDYSHNLIVDEHISLYNLFNKHGIKLILLDEYRSEITGYIQYVRENAKEYRDTFDSFSPTIDKINKFEEWQNHQKVITELLPFLISYCIGLHSNGIDSLYNLFKEKKIILNQVDFSEDEFPIELITAFTEHQPGQLTDKLFQKIKPKIKANYQNENYNEEKLNKELASKTRDCMVIDRLININNALEKMYTQKKLKKRHVILFLSSVKRVEELFNVPEFLELMPKIKGIPFNIHRKSAHVFLKLITERSKNEDTKRNLELFYSYKSIAKSKGTPSPIDYTKEISELRNRFENYNLFTQYAQFKKDIEIARNRNDGGEEMKKHLTELINIQKEKNITEWINRGEGALRKLKLIEHFIKAREIGEKLKAGKFNSSFGDAYIKGHSHRLPLLFKTGQKATDNFIQFIVESYLDSKGASPKKKISLLNTIEKRSKSLLSKNDETINDYEWLILLTLFLLLPSDDTENNSDKQVLLEINMLLPMLKEKDSNLKVEYCYLGSFAARRAKIYDRAEELISLALKEKRNDCLNKAKLNHSKCLLHYSKYRDKLENDNQKDFELLKIARLSGEEAILEYKKYEFRDTNSTIVLKQLWALYNTLAYINMLLFELSGGKKQLAQAQEYIEIIQDEEDNYNLYPEFLETEAYLNLLKFEDSGNQEFLRLAKVKIEEALNVLADDFEYDNKEYLKTEQRIDMLIKKHNP